MVDKPFHHGNLREALLLAGIDVVNSEGLEKLSLRGLAKHIGVAPSAPFKHFSDKEELILAITQSAAKEIVDAYRAALDLRENNDTKLTTACMAYLNFAEKKSNLFKLLFVSEPSFSPYQKAIDAYKDEAFGIFKKLVRDVLSDEVKSAELELTVSCWALLHGFALLYLGGRLERVKYKKEQAIKAVVSLAKSHNN